MKPISIIIPVFNREKLIVRALDSVAAQTYRPIELVVVDNASTDSSRNVVKQWIEKMAKNPSANSSHNPEHTPTEKFNGNGLKVILIDEKRKGAAQARQTGFELTTSDVVLFFDSDDEMHPDLVATVMDTFARNPRLEMVYWKTVYGSAAPPASSAAPAPSGSAAPPAGSAASAPAGSAAPPSGSAAPPASSAASAPSGSAAPPPSGSAASPASSAASAASGFAAPPASSAASAPASSAASAPSGSAASAPSGSTASAPSASAGLSKVIPKRNPRRFSKRNLLRRHMFNGMLATQTYALKADLFRRAGGWNPALPCWNDWELGLRLLLQKPIIEAIPRALVTIYPQAESITGTDFKSKHGQWEKSIVAMERVSNRQPEPLRTKLLNMLLYRRINLAALYRSEGALDLSRHLLTTSLSTTSPSDSSASSPQLSEAGTMIPRHIPKWRKYLLRFIYHYTAHGGRAAYLLWP